MATTLEHQTELAVEPDVPRSEPIARVVVGSIALGLVASLVLAILVFGGAEEFVITGALLLGFGVGWAALAALSTRLTTQPQRWATVPAAAMVAVALLLWLSSPGDDALTAAGWVWPPGLAALTIWMIVQARRHLHTRARAWVLYPVFAVLLVSAVGGMLETIAETTPLPAPTAGRRVDIGGRRMYLHCEGSGSPAVVLLGGSAENSANWSLVTPQVAGITRVCSYDRAGQGWSDDAPNAPQDGIEIATDLHRLLTRAKVRGPYVLAGHSVGGPYALTFAARYPNDVAGLALIDSSSPHQFDLSWYPRFYWSFGRAVAFFPTLARIGIARVMYGKAFGSLPPDKRAQARRVAATPREMRNQRAEFSQLRAAFRQAQALRTFGNKPLYVLTAARGQQDGWFEEQDKLATLSTNAAHRTAREATHAALLDDKDQAQNTSSAIVAVIASLRSGGHVRT